MEALTLRQKKVIEFIRNYIELEGVPPTVVEITVGLGLKSTNGVRGHLQALARKGAIELLPNVSRGIRLYDELNSEENGLPIVGRVAAGCPILATEHIEDYYPIDASKFKPKAHYLLRVIGMSMRDIGILDGDLLVVHRTTTAENGQIVVARLDEEVTVKKLKKRKYSVDLIPENPDFQTIKVDLRKERFDIEGIAVGVLRHL